MQSPFKDATRPTLEMPEVELPKFDLSKIDLSKIEMPKVDVGKAVSDAAIAVGLAKPRRSRWPFVLGAGVLVAVAGWTVMNSAAIRERLSRAKAWISDQVGAMQAEDIDQDPVAFTAAETKPLQEPIHAPVSDSTTADYPEGLGTPTESMATNGRSTAASTR